MARTNMNEYRVTLEDGTTKNVVRGNCVPVAQDFEDEHNPITQIQRTRTGLDVSIPDAPRPVFFKVSVTPQAAADANSVATPTQFTVLDRTPIVLQALPGAGFRFVGWFLTAPLFPEDEATFDPAVPYDTDAITVMAITSPAPGQERLIEARFAPAT